jgi:putative thioredoxin
MPGTVAHEVTTATFEDAVIRRSFTVPVVADFWAPWCGPCRMLSPLLERLAARSAGAWELATIDIDQEPELARRFRVQSIPAVIGFRDGKPVAQFIGAQPEPAVLRFLQQLLPSAADARASEGDRLARIGDQAGARAAYRQALAEQPTNPRALLGLANLLLRDDPDESEQLLGRIAPSAAEAPAAAALLARLRFQREVQSLPPADQAERALAADPTDSAARWALGVHAAADGAYETALEHFLAIVSRDRRYRDDGARKAMLAIFEILGPDDPITQGFRRRLAAALY